MARFDNISDEMLAAFIDGNATPEECAEINCAIERDDVFTEASDVAQDSLSFEEKLDLWKGDYGFWELGLPPVLGEDDYINDNAMKLGATTYGYEPNYELENFDPYVFQNHSNTCAIRSQQIVLRDYGVMLTQEEMMKYAAEHGWYDPDPDTGGTPMSAVGNFLDGCGVECTRKEEANIFDIVSELRDGHRVIVGLDADELWVNSETSFWKRNLLKGLNKLKDAFGGEAANHALVVAGVDVNPDDPSDIHVTLIDSGTGEVCASYPYAQFKDAWDDAHCFMVSTNEPAPYQYNHDTHSMEPSGFATAYMPSNNEMPEGLDNGFRLADSYYDKYEDYEPEYSESEPISVDSNDDAICEHTGDSEDVDSEKNIGETDGTIGENEDERQNLDEIDTTASTEDSSTTSEADSSLGQDDSDEETVGAGQDSDYDADGQDSSDDY